MEQAQNNLYKERFKNHLNHSVIIDESTNELINEIEKRKELEPKPRKSWKTRIKESRPESYIDNPQQANPPNIDVSL